MKRTSRQLEDLLLPRTIDSERRGALERCLFRNVEPLPGGLARLRARITTGSGHSIRRWVLASVATACVIAGIVWAGAQPTAVPDRAAAARLIAPPGALPHPRAIALGLADPPGPSATPDPRMASDSSSAVVFRWVAARPEPTHASSNKTPDQ